MADKTYCEGFYIRGRQTQYGEMLNCSIDMDKLIKFAQAHAKDGYLRLTISKRKTPSNKGITHSVALDTFVPKQRGQSSDAPARQSPPEPESDSPVPF